MPLQILFYLTQCSCDNKTGEDQCSIHIENKHLSLPTITNHQLSSNYPKCLDDFTHCSRCVSLFSLLRPASFCRRHLKHKSWKTQFATNTTARRILSNLRLDLADAKSSQSKRSFR